MLVVDDRIAAVGVGARRAGGHPRDRRQRRHRDARDDRHPPAHVADRDARVRRGLDAHPVLRLVLPRARQDVPARGRPTPATCSRPGTRSRPGSPPPSTGRTGCRRVDHAEAAVDALQAVPGRFVLAYGNIQAGPWEWTADPAVQAFLRTHRGRRHAGLPAGLRRHRRPGLPGEGGLRGGPRAGPAGHHARRGLGRDQRRRHPADVRERLHDPGQRLRARGHPEHRLLPPDRRDRRVAARCPPSPSRAPARATRPPGSCAGTASRLAVDGHQRVVEQRPVLRDADHARRRPLARAPGGARQGRHRDQRAPAGRAGGRLGHPRRRPRRWAGTTSARCSRARRPTSC